MDIIDGQLHEPGIDSSWGAHDPAIRWAVLSEALATLLAAVGVNGAVLHPVEDIEWALSMAAREPERFVVVPMLAEARSRVREWWDSRRWDSIDPAAPDLEERLDRTFERPGFAGLRVFATAEMDFPLAPTSGYHLALAWCERRTVPVFVAGAGPSTVVATMLRTFPDLIVVLDQMGLHPQDPHVWTGLPSLLSLAAHPTVHLKMTGLPAFTNRASDTEEAGSSQGAVRRLRQIVDAFGAPRCMWASDISQVQGRVGCANRFPREGSPDHTYAESLSFVRDASWLTDDDKRQLLGGTARRLLRWPRTEG